MSSRSDVRAAWPRMIVLAVVLVAVLAACGMVDSYAYREGAGAAYEPQMAYEEGEMVADEAAPAPSARSSGGMAPPGAPADAVVVADDASAERPNETRSERKRVYTGSLELSVARVELSRRAIIDYVTSIDGYVERSSGDLLIVRVPAESFDEAMDRIESEGEVVARSVETADVTEQYADLERRLEIATVSRNRLYELLERSTDPDERVSILREIRRLTEEVERLASALESLGELVAYSRITVRLVPRIGLTQVMREQIPFPWIARLDPLATTIGSARAELAFDVPDSFALFESGSWILAESAEGVRLRVGGRANEPAGDATFWRDALAWHLGDFYRSVETVGFARFEGVLLESKDSRPYWYLVLVAPREDELVVAEVFFPDAVAREAMLPAIGAMLEGGSL